MAELNLVCYIYDLTTVSLSLHEEKWICSGQIQEYAQKHYLMLLCLHYFNSGLFQLAVRKHFMRH